MRELRLVVAAVCAWIVVAIVLASTWQVAGLVGLTCLAIAGLLLAMRRRSRRSSLALVPLVLAVCGATAVAASARVHERQTGPLAIAARERSVAVISGVVASDPRVLAGRVLGVARTDDRVLVTVSVREVEVAGHTQRVRGTVLVEAPADGWVHLLPSQRVTAAGRFSGARPGELVAARFVVNDPPSSIGQPSRVQQAAAAVRAGLTRAVSGLPPGPRGLLPGLVDGDTSGLDQQVRDDFRATSLTHLTAVSGTNVAIMLAGLLGVAGALGIGPLGRSLWGLSGLMGFVLIARPSPSVLRAAAMGAVALLALSIGRPRQALPALGAAIVVLLVIDPDLARSVGFALSAAATAGILVFADRWAAGLPDRWPRWLRLSLAVPLAAQAACAPIIGAVFGTAGLTAVPANLLAAPAVVPATLAGVLAAGFAPVCLPLARVTAQVGGLACSWLIVVAHRLAAIPGGTLNVGSGLWGTLAAGAIGAGVVGLVLRQATRRASIAALAGCALAGLAVVPLMTNPWPAAGWSFVACDVGQGDALVVKGGPEGDVLVDTGPDPRAIRRCLSRLGVRKLSRVILTHMHADHVEGLPGVLGRIPVGRIEIGPLREPVDEWNRVVRWARSASITIEDAHLGERGSSGPASWEVLGPVAVFHGTDSDPNNASLVLALKTGGVTLLLTGDAEDLSQSALLSARGASGAISADVLKVPHHGSAHQDGRFLDSVRARITVTSVGKDNPYGHPSARTLARLSRDGAAVLRTDLDGSVAIVRTPGGVVAIPERHRSGRPGSAPDYTGPYEALGPQQLLTPSILTDPRFWCR